MDPMLVVCLSSTERNKNISTEAVTKRCSVKKGVLKFLVKNLEKYL